MAGRLYFHGAPAAFAFQDIWNHGVGLLRELVLRGSQLDITQAGSIVAIASAAPATARFLGRVWRDFHGWARLLFLSSVTIPGGDPLNASVVRWILSNKPRHHRSFTGRTEVGRHGGDRAAALKKSQHPILYSPHWSSRWFLHAGGVFVVTRSLESFSSSLSDPGYDGVGGEDLTIGCLGWSVKPVKRLIETCREFSDRQAQFFVIVYSRDRYGLAWKPKARTPIRHLDTVHFDNDVKRELLTDIRNYLSPQTQRM